VGFSIELWYVRGGCEIYNNILSECIDISRGVIKGNYDFSVKVYDNIIGHNNLVDHQNVGVLFEWDVADAFVYNTEVDKISRVLSRE